MAVTNEPAPHADPWGTLWQQYLARQQNNAALSDVVGDVTVEVALAALIDSLIGSVQAFALETVPDGWLECDGSAKSRVTYESLFEKIGTRYGVGDGATTFNIPDLRGEFIRGWDHGAGNDPDAASRTDSGDGTTGDSVGTKQADAFESHQHNIDITDDVTPNAGPGHVGGNNNGNAGNGRATLATGGNETRPRNVYMMYCIYAGV